MAKLSSPKEKQNYKQIHMPVALSLQQYKAIKVLVTQKLVWIIDITYIQSYHVEYYGAQSQIKKS